MIPQKLIDGTPADTQASTLEFLTAYQAVEPSASNLEHFDEVLGPIVLAGNPTAFVKSCQPALNCPGASS